MRKDSVTGIHPSVIYNRVKLKTTQLSNRMKYGGILGSHKIVIVKEPQDMDKMFELCGSGYTTEKFKQGDQRHEQHMGGNLEDLQPGGSRNQ